MNSVIRAKLNESLKSILPIALVVFLLSATLVPMDTGSFLLFLLGIVCLIIGLSVFTMGAEMSMQTLGSHIGKSLASSGKVWLIAFVSFVIGVIVTVSEPDLVILADQVSAVPNLVLILTVSLGVGIFLLVAVLHIVFKIKLSVLLMIFYAAAFIMTAFVPKDFWSVAFDSGGVTTGPMTVPFIMAFGAGISKIGSSEERDESAFGLVSLCSIGPILSVLILGICYNISGSTYEMGEIISIGNTREGFVAYAMGFGEYMLEVGEALLPILAFTIMYQLITRDFSWGQILRIGVGVLYTFIGLSVFLTGANMGFLPIGYSIGERLAGMSSGWLLVPVSMLIGYFIVAAEPAVHVLNKQVEQVSAGAITEQTMNLSLAIGVSLALGLSMVRVLTGISIFWILIPGYVIALGLSFFVPNFFTGIAFDSGGVASGTMMSAFVLPMAIGACTGYGADIMTQAFGCVAFVAMTPIISVQVCGLGFRVKSKRAASRFLEAPETFIEYKRPHRPGDMAGEPYTGPERRKDKTVDKEVTEAWQRG